MAQSQNELAKGVLEIANKTQVLGWDWWLVAFAINQRTHDPALKPPIPPSSFQLDVWPRVIQPVPLALHPTDTPVGPVQIKIMTYASWSITSTSSLTFTPSNGTGVTVVTITGSASQWADAHNNNRTFTVSNGVTSFEAYLGLAGGYVITPKNNNVLQWPPQLNVDLSSFENVYPFTSTFARNSNGIYLPNGPGNPPNYVQVGGTSEIGSWGFLSLDGVANSLYPVNLIAIDITLNITGPNFITGDNFAYAIVGYYDPYGNFQSDVPTCPVSGLVVAQDNKTDTTWQTVGTLKAGWIT